MRCAPVLMRSSSAWIVFVEPAPSIARHVSAKKRPHKRSLLVAICARSLFVAIEAKLPATARGR
eukprot:6401499-Alexandrium_andersonii.AAC.1